MKKLIISIFLLLSLTMSNAFTKRVEALDTDAFAIDVNGYTLPEGKGFFDEKSYILEISNLSILVVDFYYTEVNGEEVDFENNLNLYRKQVSLIDLPDYFYNDNYSPACLGYVNIVNSQWCISNFLLRDIRNNLLPNSYGLLTVYDNETFLYTYYPVLYNYEFNCWKPDTSQLPNTSLIDSIYIDSNININVYVGVLKGVIQNVTKNELTSTVKINTCVDLKVINSYSHGYLPMYPEHDNTDYPRVCIYFNLDDVEYDYILSFTYKVTIWKKFLWFGRKNTITSFVDTVYFDDIDTITQYGLSVKKTNISCINSEGNYKASNGISYDNLVIGKMVKGPYVLYNSNYNKISNSYVLNDDYFNILEMVIGYDSILYSINDFNVIDESQPNNIGTFNESIQKALDDILYSENSPTLKDKIIKWIKENIPWLLNIVKYLPVIILSGLLFYFGFKKYKFNKLKKSLKDVKNKKE